MAKSTRRSNVPTTSSANSVNECNRPWATEPHAGNADDALCGAGHRICPGCFGRSLGSGANCRGSSQRRRGLARAEAECHLRGVPSAERRQSPSAIAGIPLRLHWIGLTGGRICSGITLHHTYGVPFLPGTALKGLAAHYAHQIFGGDWAINGAACGSAAIECAVSGIEKRRQSIPGASPFGNLPAENQLQRCRNHASSPSDDLPVAHCGSGGVRSSNLSASIRSSHVRTSQRLPLRTYAVLGYV